MSDYMPPPSASSPTSGKKVKKDPNAPKRAMTSFFFFSNEVRSKIKQENPDLSFGELGKKIGEMFRELSPADKEKYEKLATNDTLRYKKELAAHKSKDDDDSDDDDAVVKPKRGDDDDDDDDDSDADGLNDENDDDSDED
jgi:HMG (high mobility group) box